MQRMFERLGGNCGCFGWLHARGAHLGGDAGCKLFERRAGRIPFQVDPQLGQLLQKRVNGGAQNAGGQSAFVARVEAAFPGLGSETWGTQPLWGVRLWHCASCLLKIQWQAAQERGLCRRWHDQQIALA